MSVSTIKKPNAIRTLEARLRGIKTVLRELEETVEDFEDALLIEKAKRRNGKKPLLNWEDVAKELGIPDPRKKS